MSDIYAITVTENTDATELFPDLETAEQQLLTAIATWAYVKHGEEFPALAQTVKIPTELAHKICSELGQIAFFALPSVSVLKHHIEAAQKEGH